MVNFRAGILAALLIACAPLPVAAQGHLVAKALGARGDRFIEMPESAAGKRYANVGAQVAIVYGEAGIEVSPAHASLSKSGGAECMRLAGACERASSDEGRVTARRG